MVHQHVSNDEKLDPAYAGRFASAPIPKNRRPDGEALPGAVYRMIHDELLLDGSSRLNMATFVTTWMEPEAEKLMAETFDKNTIGVPASRPGMRLPATPGQVDQRLGPQVRAHLSRYRLRRLALGKAVTHLEQFPPPQPAPTPGFSHNMITLRRDR